MLGLVAALEAAATDDDIRVIVLEGTGEHFCGGADIVARNADSRPQAARRQHPAPPAGAGAPPDRAVVHACRSRWCAKCEVGPRASASRSRSRPTSRIAADDARFWEPFGERGLHARQRRHVDAAAPRRRGAGARAAAARPGAQRRRGRRMGRDPSRGSRRRARRRGRRSRRAARERSDGRARSHEVVARARARTPSSQAQLANEAFALELSSRTDDFREGIAAFREKRAPRFEGR